MEDNRCFEQGCTLNAEYECPCSAPPIYTCKLHALNHMEVPNKDHALKQIFDEPYEKTREAILKFLVKRASKHKKIKENVLASFSQRFCGAKSDLDELIKEIDSYSVEMNNCFIKISEAKRIIKSEQDSILALLSLEPDEAVEKIKTLIPTNSDWYKNSKVFCGFNEKIEKMIECFIENKFQNYLDNRLAKIEKVLNEHNESINLANNELADIKNSILNIMNENNKSLRDFEEWKDRTKLKTENEIALLSPQISTIIEDLNHKLKEVENTQSQNFRNFMIAQDFEAKRSEILKNSNNNSELEKEFRRICSEYENGSSFQEKSVTQAYQGFVSTYQHKTSLFNLVEKDRRANLLIYNTETGTQESKILYTLLSLDWGTCITQLPDGKLFCFGNDPPSGITLLIDENYRVQGLPSGAACSCSSAIYFNKNIYCFGGYNNGELTLSSRFDLDRNQWNELTPLPKGDKWCNSIIFNGSIFISGYENKNLLRYSIDSNSFSIISYDFAKKKRKILIYAVRLYLIECDGGSIYESEIGNGTAWRQIANNSTIDFTPEQTYCQYNKEEIYIGCIDREQGSYFKFNLNEKRFIRLV